MEHSIDPELIDLLEVLPKEPLTAETLSSWRAMNVPLPAMDPSTLGIECSTRYAKGLNGAPDVPLRVYAPPDSSRLHGCVFHIHGGGFVMGDAAEEEPFHRLVCAQLNCVVVCVNYRLAPETRYPGNIEDCYAGLSWLFEHASSLNIDVGRVGVMGESAGGGLATALALKVRDRGEFPLAFQHLLYPMLDDRTCVLTNPHPFTGRLVWTHQSNHFAWSALLGHPPGRDGVSPYAAPARAQRLEGLPPTFIATGALDLFLEEDIDYARQLSRAGVAVELHVYPGTFHGFDLHPTAQVAQAVRSDRLAALTRAVGKLTVTGS
jgi:acetyl esterase/lipase